MRLHARKTSSKRESRIVDRGLGRGKRAFRLRCCSRGTSIVLMDLIGYVQTSADRFESRRAGVLQQRTLELDGNAAERGNWIAAVHTRDNVFSPH